MAAIVDLRSLDSGISYCRTASSLHSYSSAISTNAADNERLTPRTFLERYSLPRVVKIVPQEPVDDADRSGLMSLLSGELLMYQQYRSGKVEARSLTKSKNGERVVSSVVIPDTYQGWFSVVTERHQVKARCYNSIQRLVSARVTIFLTMSDVVGYTQNSCRTNSGGMRQQYSKMVIKCGSVLKLLAVYQDITGESTARSKRLSWPLIGRHETNRYAQCLSSSDQVVFISVTSHGQFYAVATAMGTSDDTVSKVYQLPKLLRTFPLPVRVCIVTPNKPQGSMLLESYRKEDVILTCLLDSCADVPVCLQTPEEDDKGGGGTTTQFRLLEMDVDSKFYVVKLGPRELDEKRLFHSGLVQRGLRFCRENHEAWARQLKFIHHIYPRNCDDVPSEVPKKNSGKPTRKISLGDKKTVKSASFRFSTSFPEDLRPVKHPLPRKPNLNLKKSDSKMPVETAPCNESPYYNNNDDEFYNEIYSNVPDGDKYVNFRENNKNLKGLGVERLGANNNMCEGLDYVHYSNTQEVHNGDIHRGYEELITFQSEKRLEESKLNGNFMLKSKNVAIANGSNTNERRICNNSNSDRNSTFESSVCNDVVSDDYSVKELGGSEKRLFEHNRIANNENTSQQRSLFGRQLFDGSSFDKNSAISSQNSYYCYNKTVEDVGKNFSKLMLINNRQNSIDDNFNLNSNEEKDSKEDKRAGNEKSPKDIAVRINSDKYRVKGNDVGSITEKMEHFECHEREKRHCQESDFNKVVVSNLLSVKHDGNVSLSDEPSCFNEGFDTTNGMFVSTSQHSTNFSARSCSKTQVLVNGGELLEKEHKTVWASPVVAQNSVTKPVSYESNTRPGEYRIFTDTASVNSDFGVFQPGSKSSSIEETRCSRKIDLPSRRVGRTSLNGINSLHANNPIKTDSEMNSKNNKPFYPIPIVPRTRVRTAQQRQRKVTEHDNSTSKNPPDVFVSTAFLPPSSSINERAADRHTSGDFRNSENKDKIGIKKLGPRNGEEGGIERVNDFNSGHIFRNSRRGGIKEISSIITDHVGNSPDQQSSSTNCSPSQYDVTDKRNINHSDGLKKRLQKGIELENGKTPENGSRLQFSSRYSNSDEVTRARTHNQSSSRTYDNSKDSILFDKTKRNENLKLEESLFKMDSSTRKSDVDNNINKKASNDLDGRSSRKDSNSLDNMKIEQNGMELRSGHGNSNGESGRRNLVDENYSTKGDEFDGNDFKTKIMIDDCRYGVIGAKNVCKPSQLVDQKHATDDRAVSPMYRVVRKPQPCPNIIKPFYKTRVQIGPDFSSSTDVPYSVVVDQISTATEVGSAEENIYAEIAGDSYQSPSRYFSFACQRRKLSSRYDYRANGGSDGTFSNTTTSSSNADESSV